MTRFATVPWNPLTHGYLTIDLRANELIRIIDDFNTFAEIRNDLELINPKLYELSLSQPKSKGITYKITGHGFLRKAENEL